MPIPHRINFEIDSSWSAHQVADEAYKLAKLHYAEHPEILDLIESFSPIRGADHGLWSLMTADEKAGLDNIPIVLVPTGRFNAMIAPAPAGNDKYIVLDLCVLSELTNFLSALSIGGSPAMAACILQGARRDIELRIDFASWTKVPLENFKEALEKQDHFVPYQASFLFALPIAIEFVLLHEFGHHTLGHFEYEYSSHTNVPPWLDKSTRLTNHDLEFSADAWAMSVISRLPIVEFSSWLLSVELVFWYLGLIELFNLHCRSINGLTPLPHSHPSLHARAEKISRIGEKVITDAFKSKPMPEEILNNITDRQKIFGWINTMRKYTEYLAECYCANPNATIEIHEDMQHGEIDVDLYIEKIKVLAKKHHLDGIVGIANRIVRYFRRWLF